MSFINQDCAEIDDGFVVYREFVLITKTGLPVRSPKNYKGLKVLFRKNKGNIKVQRGQIYHAKPWISSIYSALEW